VLGDVILGCALAAAVVAVVLTVHKRAQRLEADERALAEWWMQKHKEKHNDK
jgi:hypothetical protein